MFTPGGDCHSSRVRGKNCDTYDTTGDSWVRRSTGSRRTVYECRLEERPVTETGFPRRWCGLLTNHVYTFPVRGTEVGPKRLPGTGEGSRATLTGGRRKGVLRRCYYSRVSPPGCSGVPGLSLSRRYVARGRGPRESFPSTSVTRGGPGVFVTDSPSLLLGP